MNRFAFGAAFGAGLLTVGWIGLGFVGHSPLALSITLLIAATYLLGAHELRGYRRASSALSAALDPRVTAPTDVAMWLGQLPASLRPAVRSRIEGERLALPGPALTPYLVGLLVMLGMLGTFVGMVLTFQGAVFALEGSADLQAIRSALAAPIKGLGLSFGTSVAGVAASAALGLMSAMARRERAEVARRLDAHVASELRAFSLVHQRQETFKALQQQAHALPEVVGHLQAMMDGLERRSQQLNDQLLGQQAQFHREVGVAYTELARTVGNSLQEALAAGARAAGDSIRPVVEATMAEIAHESQVSHQRQMDATQTQLHSLVSDIGATARDAAEGWRTTLAAQASADEAQRRQWAQALHAVAGTLQSEWQQAGAQALAQQQAVCDALARTAADISSQGREQARQTADDMARLLGQSDALVQARLQAEAAWAQQQTERTEQLASLWRSELAALRNEEAARGDAAVARLGELQDAVARQLATLGAALETPMTRLLQTAAEVPQAAAEVIAQMRGEMTRLSERDNAALEERNALVQQLGTLLLAVQQTTTEQRAAIESLVDRAAATLAQTGQQVGATLDAQAEQASQVAARVNASAIELATLGEAFGHGVSLFSSSNQQLMGSLQHIEATLQQAMARSDEQLAYYVAQAREVIDLSISSQQGLVEDLRRLRHALPEGSTA